MRVRSLMVIAVVLVCLCGVVLAQDEQLPLSNWSAPPYWNPTVQPRAEGEPGRMIATVQGMQAQAEALPSSPLPFVAITPCRIADTRVAVDDGFHRPNFGDGETRTFNLPGSPDCTGLPATAGAWSLNVQFRPISQLSFLTAYPNGTTMPGVSTMTAGPAAWVQNAAIVPAGTNGAIDVYCQYAGRVVIDINGYYGPQTVVTSLNTLTGDVTLANGANVTITPSGNTLTIAATGGPGGELPAGTTYQTLYNNGSAWTASSALTNDGSNIGVSGNLNLPDTTNLAGIINLGGVPFIHGYMGSSNTFLGRWAGNFTMTSGGNTGVGQASLNHTTVGYNNTAVGDSSLQENRAGSSNTAVGSYALWKNFNASYNTAVGHFSMKNNTTAGKNTAVGYGSLYTQSYDNVGVPWDSENTAVGFEALLANQPASNADGTWNTAVGSWALRNNSTGYANTASGRGSLNANTTGYANTASGAVSLYSNTTGAWNTALGAYGLYANSTGAWNTASGGYSLASNTTGVRNTANGGHSLLANTVGQDNTAMGYESLRSNTTAAENTAVGALALYTQSYDNAGALWTSRNTAIGFRSLYSDQPDSLLSGMDNTAVGAWALASVTTGSDNVAIGTFAGFALQTGSYNIYIGGHGSDGLWDEEKTIRIGGPYQDHAYIAGIYGAVCTGCPTVMVDTDGHLGTNVSSIRFKQDVADMGDATSGLMRLRPVTFRYKARPDGPLQYGLIAEEVEQVIPALVAKNGTGQAETVLYHELPAMLLNELQKQRREIVKQTATIVTQQAQIEALTARLAALEERLSRRP